MLLTLCGKVKIGNVGECMLSDESELKGPGAIASLVESMLKGHGDRVPDGPEMANLHRFVEDAGKQSNSQLRGHNFLKTSPGTGCLLPHVCIAMRSVRKRWKLPVTIRSAEGGLAALADRS